jgi:16S rRNA (guanine527-N7)-methyltransferase
MPAAQTRKLVDRHDQYCKDAVDAPLKQYAALLLQWNRTVNLTGARSEAQVAAQIANAEGLLGLDWSRVGQVIDIGSGGGLPAIPLAIHLPMVRFTLLEANSRKCAFLEQVAGRLELANVTLAPGRAEELAHRPDLRERFDRAISRAAARPPVLLELALPFVRTGGEIVAEVSPLDPHLLAGAARRLGGGEPRLEHAPAGRGTFLVVPKLAPTPARFPRRPGVPNRKPLA